MLFPTWMVVEPTMIEPKSDSSDEPSKPMLDNSENPSEDEVPVTLLRKSQGDFAAGSWPSGVKLPPTPQNLSSIELLGVRHLVRRRMRVLGTEQGVRLAWAIVMGHAALEPPQPLTCSKLGFWMGDLWPPHFVHLLQKMDQEGLIQLGKASSWGIATITPAPFLGSLLALAAYSWGHAKSTQTLPMTLKDYGAEPTTEPLESDC